MGFLRVTIFEIKTKKGKQGQVRVLHAKHFSKVFEISRKTARVSTNSSKVSKMVAVIDNNWYTGMYACMHDILSCSYCVFHFVALNI